MPYFLSQPIDSDTPGLWGEGNAYQSSVIYDIAAENPSAPPVNYHAHTIKPHSVAHVDFDSHINKGGKPCDHYFQLNRDYFWGRVVVLRIPVTQWQPVNTLDGVRLWRVGRDEIIDSLKHLGLAASQPDKLFIVPDSVPSSARHAHDPNFVFVLTPDAANWLVENPRFAAFGTSWKSSDFEPGSRERPIHKILLRQAVLYECLNLSKVPAGEYFLSGAPLNLCGASESPVNPILYGFDELRATLAEKS